MAVIIDYHVFWLQVSVDNVVLMERFEGYQYLRRIELNPVSRRSLRLLLPQKQVHFVLNEPEEILTGTVIENEVNGVCVCESLFQMDEKVGFMLLFDLIQEHSNLLLILHMLYSFCFIDRSLRNLLQSVQFVLIDYQLNRMVFSFPDFDSWLRILHYFLLLLPYMLRTFYFGFLRFLIRWDGKAYGMVSTRLFRGSAFPEKLSVASLTSGNILFLSYNTEKLMGDVCGVRGQRLEKSRGWSLILRLVWWLLRGRLLGKGVQGRGLGIKGLHLFYISINYINMRGGGCYTF